MKISDIADSSRIVEMGVREFLDKYKDTVYSNGTTAKLGIFSGSIEKAEEVIYPLVASIVSEYGLTSDCILKFHKGNKTYPQPVDSQLEFDTLDSSISKIRIVILVQVGKEGWDCRSLTGIILSQEGDCSKNMVLQTTCRCLRQVDKESDETAIIYLNESNADKLNNQLQQQQRISLQEFATADNKKIVLKRYNRMNRLKLPKVDFYQLRVKYNTLVVEDADPEKFIPSATNNTETKLDILKTTDFSMKISETDVDDSEKGKTCARFTQWLYDISKKSFDLFRFKCSRNMRAVFNTITYMKDGYRYFSSKYNVSAVEENIRKAFYEKPTETVEEAHPQEASLLNIANFTDEVRRTTRKIIILNRIWLKKSLPTIRES